MPQAPNLETLLDFEGQIETATQTILEAGGVTAFISQEALKIPLINTGIGCDVGAALDVLDQVNPGPAWPAGVPWPQEYFRYPAALELVVEIPRDQEGNSLPGVPTLLREIRGKVRKLMLRIVMPFNDVNLPYYRVTDIRPAGTTTGQMPEKNVDFCSLRYSLTFDIKPDAWPNWPAPQPPDAQTIIIMNDVTIADVIAQIISMVPAWIQITYYAPDVSGVRNAYALVWSINPPP